MLGGSHCNVGQVLIDDDPTAALASYDAAVRVLQAVHDREPRDAVARQFLRNSLYGRGRAHTALQHWAEAADDWRRCAQLSASNERGWFDRQRVLALARAGLVERAREEAEQQVGDADDADARVFLARVDAIAAGAVTERRQECGDRAMQLLLEAMGEGFDVARLRDDADFAVLREREDFRKLVGDP